MMIHSGEKPHRCFVCEKSFRNPANLTHKIMIHTGEKPHRWSGYDKSWLSGCLTDHTKTHIVRSLVILLCESLPRSHSRLIEGARTFANMGKPCIHEKRWKTIRSRQFCARVGRKYRGGRRHPKTFSGYWAGESHIKVWQFTWELSLERNCQCANLFPSKYNVSIILI